MADRAFSLLGISPFYNPGTTISASEENLPGQPVGKLIDKFSIAEWLSTITPSFPVTVDVDLQAAEFLDTVCLFKAGAALDRSIKSFEIQHASSPGGPWTTVLTVSDAFGATTPAVQGFKFWTFTRTQARYWRLKCNSRYGSQYVGSSEWFMYDSTLLGTEILAGATGTYWNQTSSTIAKLTNGEFDNFGWYTNSDEGSLDLDFGAEKYVRGLSFCCHYTSNGASFRPGTMEVFKSDTGLHGSWELVTRVDFEGTSPGLGAAIDDAIYGVDFGRVIKTRYLRLSTNRQGGGSSASMLMFEARIFSPLTPVAPPDPTALTAVAKETDPNAIYLGWAQAAGDDALLEDLETEVEVDRGSGFPAEAATDLPGSAALIIPDHTDFDYDDTDFYFFGWLVFDSGGGRILSKGNFTSYTNAEFEFYRDAGIGIHWSLFDTGGNFNDITALVGASNGEKYFFIVGYDGTTRETFISVQGGTLKRQAIVGTVLREFNFDISIGKWGTISNGYMNGGQQNLGYVRTAKGAGGVPTAAEIAELYNGGVGTAYHRLSASLRAKILHYWPLWEPSGTRDDIVGSLDATEAGSCGTRGALIRNDFALSKERFFREQFADAGTYKHRVRSVHKHHAGVSSWVTLASGLTLPATVTQPVRVLAPAAQEIL